MTSQTITILIAAGSLLGGLLLGQIVRPARVEVSVPDIRAEVRAAIAESASELSLVDDQWKATHLALLDDLAKAEEELDRLGNHELAKELNRRWGLTRPAGPLGWEVPEEGPHE